MSAAMPLPAPSPVPRPWAVFRPPSPAVRQGRGLRAHAAGLSAEDAACAALQRDGWRILARRLRTSAGEIDIAAERDGLLAFVEVKARATLADAACSVLPRQQARLLAAAEAALAMHPQWGPNGVRFDLVVVDRRGAVRRIADAFRQE